MRRVVPAAGAALGTSIAFALGLLLTTIPTAHAQDSGQDMFDTSAFDQNVQQSKQQEQKTRLETQFGGNLLWDTSVTTTTDFSGYGGGGSFSGKAFVKVSVPDFGAAYLAYNYSKSLYQGAAGTIPGAPFGPGGSLLAQSAGDLFGASYELWRSSTRALTSRRKCSSASATSSWRGGHP